MKPYGFLVGAGRSGSSLVHEVLARHADVGFLTNVEDRVATAPASVGRAARWVYPRLPPSWTEKGRLRLAPSEGYRALAREVSPVLARSGRDLTEDDAEPWLADRLRRFFDEHATHAAAGGRLSFTHKFTGWPRARLLATVFPDARFVHVVRDGRAVAASLLQTTWWDGWQGPERWRYGPLPADLEERWRQSGSFPLLAGLTWLLMVDAADACAERLGDAWLTVRYEDVLADPLTSFDRVAEHLRLPADPAFPGAVAATALRPDRRDGFSRALSPATVDLLDDVLGGALRRHGYRV